MKYFVRVYRYVDYEYNCHNIYPLDQYFLKVCTYDWISSFNFKTQCFKNVEYEAKCECGKCQRG